MKDTASENIMSVNAMRTWFRLAPRLGGSSTRRCIVCRQTTHIIPRVHDLRQNRWSSNRVQMLLTEGHPGRQGAHENCTFIPKSICRKIGSVWAGHCLRACWERRAKNPSDVEQRVGNTLSSPSPFMSVLGRRHKDRGRSTLILIVSSRKILMKPSRVELP